MEFLGVIFISLIDENKIYRKTKKILLFAYTFFFPLHLLNGQEDKGTKKCKKNPKCKNYFKKETLKKKTTLWKELWNGIF